MGVTLHPGPFSIHQERCMDRLNVRTRSESCGKHSEGDGDRQRERGRERELNYILRHKADREEAGIRLRVGAGFNQVLIKIKLFVISRPVR